MIKMGYRLKYHNLKVVKYSNFKGKRVWGVVEGNTLVSGVRGLTKTQAQKQLKYFQKVREFRFP